jgi:HAE1 family hydrophobic/amphiphilic exporter-1
MNLPSFSVKRPIFTTMVTLILVILGAVSLSRLQIDMLPNIELPTLSIRTDYEGASPEVMERLVTQIIEEIVATVPGVEEITSSSSEGRSRVRVSFVWGTEIDTAAIDVQGKLEDEINELPDDIVRPRIRKFDIASFPVVLLGISSNLDPVELTELIEVQIRYRFARIPGVAQVDVWGGFNREVRIELDPDRIKAVGLPLDRVLDAIRDANLDLPAGKIEQGRYEVTLRAPAEFINLDQIRETVIVQRDNAAITLGQIAEIKDTYEKLTRSASYALTVGAACAWRFANRPMPIRSRCLNASWLKLKRSTRPFLRSRLSRSSTRAISSSGPSPTLPARYFTAADWPSWFCCFSCATSAARW